MPQPEFNFEWDPRKATTNGRKHRVSFERAATVFRDSEALSLFDRAHSRSVSAAFLSRDSNGAVLCRECGRSSLHHFVNSDSLPLA